MVRVKGPMFSFEANGKFADALVFQKNLYGPMVRVHVPRNPHTSILQAAWRSEFGEAFEAWRSLPGFLKRVYSDEAKRQKLAGNSLFLREFSQIVAGSMSGIAVSGWTYCGYFREVKKFAGFVGW